MADPKTPATDMLKASDYATAQGLTTGIPPASDYDVRLLGWCKDAINEGEGMLKREAESEDVDENIKLVMGEFHKLKIEREKPSYRSLHTANRLPKNINDIASAITDFRPTGQYRTYNAAFEHQGMILDKLLNSWYYTINADLKNQLVAKLSLVARTGYAHLVFDPTMWGGIGDIDIIPRDYRDVIPIRPNSKLSIQDALGIIIKSRATVNWGRARYPNKAALIRPTLDASYNAALTSEYRVGSPALTYLEQQKGQARDFAIPSYNHYDIYVRDNSINKSSSKVWVGPEPVGESPWGYWVDPEEQLYPRGRLIVVANMDCVLWDGPNPYWHGMFPIIKLTLDPWPWSFLGKSALADVKSAQLQENELLQGMMDSARKALRPGVIADKNAIPRGLLDRLDTREPGFKLQINPSAGNGLIMETPNPLPEYVMAMYQDLKDHIDYSMGILDMRALARLQGTGALNTDVEQLLENVGPSIRERGRILECYIRELATMMKGNFFQFYTRKRRIQILGDNGIDLSDYDFDPDSLVPDFAGDFDKLSDQEKKRFFKQGMLKQRSERAQEHQHSFAYYISPNSLLSLSKAKDQLIQLQLFRMGMLDPWTLWESLEVPNVGPAPSGTIPERMQQASQMGLTGAVSAAGRKSSGQDLPRLKISESG